MTSIDPSLNLGATRNQTFGAASIRGFLVSLVRRYRNRRAVISLSEFNDLQLADIGLTRKDLNRAMRGGMFADHSRELARTALLRRSGMYLP